MSIVEVRPATRRRPSPPVLPVGTAVTVRNRYMGTWSAGFVVVAHEGEGYRIRRASDGAVIDQVIAADDVREPYDRCEPYLLEAPDAGSSPAPEAAGVAAGPGRRRP